MANVSLVGAEKYSWKGWETVPDGINRYGDACARHLAAEGYEEYDKDTGSLHCAQVAWNALAKLELVLRQKRETRQTTEKVHPLAVSGPDGYSEPGGVVEVCFCGEPSYYSTGLCKNCSELNTSFDG